jgi:hypothetical protein
MGRIKNKIHRCFRQLYRLATQRKAKKYWIGHDYRGLRQGYLWSSCAGCIKNQNSNVLISKSKQRENKILTIA